MRWLSQVAALTVFNVKTMRQRLGWVATAMLGMALVVLVLVGVLSIGQGFAQTMRETGSPSRAIVLRSGADGEMMSIVTRDDARLVAEAPGAVRAGADRAGSPGGIFPVEVAEEAGLHAGRVACIEAATTAAAASCEMQHQQDRK